MITPELRMEIAEMMNAYAHALDDDRLEEWPDFFAADGVYRVVPRENIQQGLPGVIMVCFGHGMLRDRIKVLREANEFNIHTDRHVVGMPSLRAEGDAVRASTSYALFQTDQEGESRLFSVGRYDDLIGVIDGRPRFRERTVIVDSFAIPNLLATPI